VERNTKDKIAEEKTKQKILLRESSSPDKKKIINAATNNVINEIKEDEQSKIAMIKEDFNNKKGMLSGKLEAQKSLLTVKELSGSNVIGRGGEKELIELKDVVTMSEVMMDKDKKENLSEEEKGEGDYF